VFLAALNPSGKAVEVLLAHGVDITLGTKETGYIQHYAAVCATAASTQFLEEHKLPLFSEDVSKKTPLMWWATSAHPSKEVLDLLLTSYAKAQIDAVDTTKYSALHNFCMHRNLASKDSAQWVVKALIVSKKAKMTQVAGWDKHTPLGLAARRGDAALVEAMVEFVPRLNLNKGDKYGRTPLLMAARNGHANIVALLMKHHANASIPDTSGNTPLHYAAAYGWLECVHILL
jgi:ankyrin repeat protein